jgi:hypothetical protein
MKCVRWILVAALPLGVADCGRTVDMVPLNDVAAAAGNPKMDMTLYGTGYGPATVTMPSGEILNGHYRLAVGGAVTTTAYTQRGSAVATGTAVSTPMNNPFTLQAGGARGTSMTCQGSAGGMGHGDAVCTMNGGAQYQMMF